MGPRISVVGVSGSGKTTLAARLAGHFHVPHVELDSIFHQPGWTPLPSPEFRDAVAAALVAPGWIVDGNYGSHVRDIVWGRASTVVWLDLPRHTVMRRIARRTLQRVATGTELWNGNRERWRNLLERRPEENILLWAWTQHGPYRQHYEEALIDPQWEHLEFVRLRTARQLDDYSRHATTPLGPSTP